MPFRFQKRIKLAKGVSLNLSKKSIGIGTKVGPFSASTGTHGRKRIGFSIPGSGVGYHKTFTSGAKQTAGGALSDENMARGSSCLTTLIFLPVRAVLLLFSVFFVWPVKLIVGAVQWVFLTRQRAIIAGAVVFWGIALLLLQYAALTARGLLTP